LLWDFDLLRRFRDAQAKELKRDADYLTPRALWWAFNPESAKRRGLPEGERPEVVAIDPSETKGKDSVVLIDEIDKADPDVPNNLLVTLGSLQFPPPPLGGTKVEHVPPPLVFITSNDERDLPAAFVRRCIVLYLKEPYRDRLIEIATEH